MTASLPAQLAHLDQKDAQDHLRALAQAQGVTLSEAQAANLLGTPQVTARRALAEDVPTESPPTYQGMDLLRLSAAFMCISSTTTLGLTHMVGLSQPFAVVGGVVASIAILGPLFKGSWVYSRRLLQKAKRSI